MSTILVTASGFSKPNLLAETLALLASKEIRILDMAHQEIHRASLLSFKLDLERLTPARKRALALKLKLHFRKQKMHCEIRKENGEVVEPWRSGLGYVLTLFAPQIHSHAILRVIELLKRYHLKVSAIRRLSEEGLGCVEVYIKAMGVEYSGIKKELLNLTMEEGVDAALQKEGLFRYAKRLVVMDIDSTLIRNEIIDELAREKGVYDQVKQITERAMKGELNFDESLRERCLLLKGLRESDLEKVYKRLELTSGAEALIRALKRLGLKVALISGGFTYFGERLKARLGVDFMYANRLEMKSGVLTGQVLPPIVNAERKAELLEGMVREMGIELAQVIAIGDGANDLLMLEKAGLGVAYHAKPILREKADASVNYGDLRSVLYLLGISGRELRESEL